MTADLTTTSVLSPSTPDDDTDVDHESRTRRRRPLRCRHDRTMCSRPECVRDLILHRRAFAVDALGLSGEARVAGSATLAAGFPKMRSFVADALEDCRGLAVEVQPGLASLGATIGRGRLQWTSIDSSPTCAADGVLDGTPEHLPIATGSAAAVLMIGGWADLADEARFVREARRVLRSDGRLVLVELTGAEHPSRPPLVSAERMLEVLTGHGLRTVDAAVAVPSVGSWASAHDRIDDELARRSPRDRALMTWLDRRRSVSEQIDAGGVTVVGLSMTPAR